MTKSEREFVFQILRENQETKNFSKPESPEFREAIAIDSVLRRLLDVSQTEKRENSAK